MFAPSGRDRLKGHKVTAATQAFAKLAPRHNRVLFTRARYLQETKGEREEEAAGRKWEQLTI